MAERQTYAVSFLASNKNQVVEPINGLAIPNITIPVALQGKKRVTQTETTIGTQIRPFFNSVTAGNVDVIREQLRKVVIEKAQTPELLSQVAYETFEHFLVNEPNIPNYVKLLNAIHGAAVMMEDKKTKEKKISLTIRDFFLENCRRKIFENIKEENIHRLAQMNEYDDDQLDAYNKEREKMMNLIATLCALYDQRDTTNINLSGRHLATCVTALIDNHKNIYQKFMAQFDEETGEVNDEDEEENELYRKMLILYEEQLYIFMVKEKSSFEKDPQLANLVERTKTEVIPAISVDYLVSNYSQLFK
jgi:hypothetical protein